MCDYRNQKFINVFNGPFKELLLLLHATPELLMAPVLGTTNTHAHSRFPSHPLMENQSDKNYDSNCLLINSNGLIIYS